MASRIIIDPADLIQEHLRASRWDEAVALYERGLGREDRQNLATRLAYAIALIRVGRAGSGVKLLTPELLGLSNARVDLRRFVIRDLLEAGMPERAATILERIVEQYPDSIEEHRLLGSVLGRLGRMDESLKLARKVLELEP